LQFISVEGYVQQLAVLGFCSRWGTTRRLGCFRMSERRSGTARCRA
jgi:hypothetical protein